MAKCLGCLDANVYGDDLICKTCREKTEAPHTGREQSPAVPLGAVCDRHSSALAHWIASRLDSDHTILMCDHCAKYQRRDLEDAGWLVTGHDIECGCVTCTRPVPA